MGAGALSLPAVGRELLVLGADALPLPPAGRELLALGAGALPLPLAGRELTALGAGVGILRPVARSQENGIIDGARREGGRKG